MDNDNGIQMDEATRLQLINITAETMQIQCQLFFEQSQSRRALIVTSVKDFSLKALLQSQDIDKLLF